MKRLIAPLVLLAAVGGALALTAGGGGALGDEETPGASVPQLSVARLSGDGEFALGQLAAAPTPTLLWIWAPWCEVCNHEAPAIERLAADARGELAVVAIGGRDKAANGPACEIERLVGVYTNPRHVMLYTSNGEVRQECSLVFAARATGGEPTTSSESSEVRWISPDELDQHPMHPSMRQRVEHVLEQRSAPFIG